MPNPDFYDHVVNTYCIIFNVYHLVATSSVSLSMYIALLKHSLPCFQYVYCPLEIGIELFSTYFALLKCLLPRCRQHLLPRCRQHLLPCCHQRLLPRCLCLYCPVLTSLLSRWLYLLYCLVDTSIDVLSTVNSFFLNTFLFCCFGVGTFCQHTWHHIAVNPNKRGMPAATK